MKVRFNQTVGTKIPVIMMIVKVVINNDSDYNKRGHLKWGIVENSLIMEKGHQIVGCEITMWS